VLQEKAVQQIIDNKKYLQKILMQKFEISVYSEYDFWMWANTNSNSEYQENVSTIFGNFFWNIASLFMIVIYVLCAVFVIKKAIIKKKEADKVIYSTILISMMILGYFMILVLGNTQYRYKVLIMPYMFVLAGGALDELLQVLCMIGQEGKEMLIKVYY